MKFLEYLESHVINTCNLNCRGCSHFSNIVKEEDSPVEFATFERDFKILGKLFDHIFMIRLLGGEPLLVPNLTDYVRVVRESFPKTDLRVVSNGLLIPSADEKMLRELGKLGVTFDISCYPPTNKIRSKIEEKLAKCEVGCNISAPVNEFHRRFNIKGTYNPEEMFQACPSKICTFVNNGKLSMCPAPQTSRFLNKHFDLDIDCQEDILYLTDPDITADKILEYRSHPLKTCRYCSDKPEDYKWFAGGTPQLEDWLVQEAIEKE